MDVSLALGSVFTDTYLSCIGDDLSEVVLSVVDYPPGEYDFTVTVTDVFEQTATVSLRSLRLTGLLNCLLGAGIIVHLLCRTALQSDLYVWIC